MSTAPLRTPESGLVVIDKPGGMTSHDVVARVRRLAGTRKVGHAGTLDPMATGVLLLGVEKATRLLGHLMLGQKHYDATIRLGAATDTDDAEGEVTAFCATGDVSTKDVQDALGRFVGEIEQVPSSVSAIKVDGQRAYARVRAGETVTLAARRVTIESLELGDVRRQDDFLDVDISVRCSSGTYIRAIARDLGAKLGVGGHLTRLRRTAVGPFALSEARELPSMEHPAPLKLVSLSAAASQCFPVHVVDVEGTRDVSFGRKLARDLGTAGPVAVFDESGEFLALYEQRGTLAVPVAVFAPSS